jgi:hypothetical protein
LPERVLEERRAAVLRLVSWLAAQYLLQPVAAFPESLRSLDVDQDGQEVLLPQRLEPEAEQLALASQRSVARQQLR